MYYTLLLQQEYIVLSHRAHNLLLLEPENGNLTSTIALLYQNLGETSLALEYLDRTIEIDPSHSSVYMTKAQLYISESMHVYLVCVCVCVYVCVCV